MSQNKRNRQLLVMRMIVLALDEIMENDWQLPRRMKKFHNLVKQYGGHAIPRIKNSEIDELLAGTAFDFVLHLGEEDGTTA